MKRLSPGILAFLAGLVLATSSATRALAQDNEPTVQPVVRFDNNKVVRAQIRDQRDLRIMERISPDRWSHGAGIGPVDYRITPDMMPALDASGVPYTVLIDNVQALIDAEKQGVGDGWYDQYHTLPEIETYLQGLADTYPALAEMFVVGNSLEGRPIRGIRIVGAGGSNGKPDVVYAGGIHAREWITTMAMPYTAETLITSYGSDPFLTELVDRINFYIIPVQNVDGFVYTQSNRMWRKNRRNNGNGTFGVDLNRNYATGWGGPGSSGDPGNETYRGTAPFSEPESQVMRDFLSALPDFAAWIDVHSYGQLILQPYGYTNQLPPDHETYQMIGGDMESQMESLYGSNYTHGNTYDTIYPASGITQDWTYVEQGAVSFGYELRDTGQFGFILPPDQIIPASEECFAGCMELAKFLTTRLRIDFPNGRPAVADPGQPTTVDVEIVGINGGQYQTGTGKVQYRIGNSGPFTEQDLAPLGNDLFEATLPPAQCGDLIQYYFQAQSTDGFTQYSPVGAPSDVYDLPVTYVDVVFEDDFQIDRGWTVTNQNVAAGAWVRVVPSRGGVRGDPPSDYDGSGMCYVTGNGVDEDLDGGPTILTSPTMNLAGAPAAFFRCAIWMYNDDGDDLMNIQVSNDNGGNWTTMMSVNNSSGWQEIAINVGDYTTFTSQMQFRFSVADNPNNSVTEAGVDALSVSTQSCDDTSMVLAVGQLTGGQPGQFDVTNATPNAMTYLAYSRRGLGSTYVPQLNVTLDLRDPAQAGSGQRADGDGNVSWILPIPNAASGRRVWFQAAQFERTSNVVETVVQ